MWSPGRIACLRSAGTSRPARGKPAPAAVRPSTTASAEKFCPNGRRLASVSPKNDPDPPLRPEGGPLDAFYAVGTACPWLAGSSASQFLGYRRISAADRIAGARRCRRGGLVRPSSGDRRPRLHYGFRQRGGDRSASQLPGSRSANRSINSRVPAGMGRLIRPSCPAMLVLPAKPPTSSRWARSSNIGA